MAIAWVFPGQGSQKVGMADPVLSLSGASQRFAMASELLGRDLLAICQGNGGGGNGPDDLNDTRNTQPALFVVESLLVDNLIEQGRDASLVAGHSLGELVALYAAGVFDLETGLKLMQTRSELMAAAGGGAMTAVIGFDRSQLEALVNDTDGVSIANDNSDAQVVISGATGRCGECEREPQVQRAIPLAVSGAFHSPFMAEAAEAFAATLDGVSFRDARILAEQQRAHRLHRSSRPQGTVKTTDDHRRPLAGNHGLDGGRWHRHFVEIGPGNVLSGLAKRSMNGVTTAQIASSGDLGL